MILLITPFVRGRECAAAVQQATGETTEIADSLRQAASLLRVKEYSAVVVDQYMLEADPDAGDLALQHAGAAIPVFVNLAISGCDRVVREIQSALRRHEKEAAVARTVAKQMLHNELKGAVTALLLSCELALEVPNLPQEAQAKMRAVHDVALELRLRLETAA